MSIKLKEVLVFVFSTVIFTSLSAIIIFFAGEGQFESARELQVFTAKISTSCGLGAGWIAYSVYKKKLTVYGGFEEKMLISIQSTVITISSALILMYLF